LYTSKNVSRNCLKKYSIITFPFSPLSYHGHSYMIVPEKRSESYLIYREQAESRFWSGQECGESLHIVIEENYYCLFHRITTVSRSRKISVIAQKYCSEHTILLSKIVRNKFSISSIWIIKNEEHIQFLRQYIRKQ